MFIVTEYAALKSYACKPSVLFVGHKRTVQTQIRRRSTQHLISVSTVCIQNISFKFE